MQATRPARQHRGIRRPWSIALVLPCLALAVVACNGHGKLRTIEVSDLAWPAGDPRVSLQEMVELHPKSKSGPVAFPRSASMVGSREAFRRPFDVAWIGSDLLVTDPDGGRVARITPDGRATFSSVGLFSTPVAVTNCPAGIVVSDPSLGRVALLGPELELVRWLAEEMERPTGVACNGERIFVAETAAHRIAILGGEGGPLYVGERGRGPGGFNFPTFLTVDGGVLWVADAMNFRVQRFDAESGKFLGGFGSLGDAPGEMPRIKGIAVDRAGHLWVADGHLDLVSLYDPDGSFLLSIGGNGAGPAEFSFPAGIAADDDGRVVVADSLNRRLKIFRLLDRSVSQGS